MQLMAKKKPTRPAKPNRSPSWRIYVMVDPELEQAYERYVAGQPYEPTKVQVVERALKKLFAEAGCWPVEGEPAGEDD
jgi:hypothetical protein